MVCLHGSFSKCFCSPTSHLPDHSAISCHTRFSAPNFFYTFAQVLYSVQVLQQCEPMPRNLMPSEMSQLRDACVQIIGKHTRKNRWRWRQNWITAKEGTILAYTQQYTDFNPLIEKNVNGGFTILAFPCNQFYLQV